MNSNIRPGKEDDISEVRKGYLLEKLSVLLKTGIFRLRGDALEGYPRMDDSNPIVVSKDLRRKLLAGSIRQEVPYLWEDDWHVFFSCIRCGLKASSGEEEPLSASFPEVTETYYLLGPMSSENLDILQRHRFCLTYGIPREAEKDLPHYTLYEVLNAVCALTGVVCGRELTESDLLQANHLSYEAEANLREQVLYSMEEDEQEFYRHTYQEERALLDKVREGDTAEAIHLSGIMDAQIGKLSAVELDHWRNLLIVSVTLCARAAIEGGLEPHTAYRVSGFYIRKGTGCRDSARVVEIRNDAVRDLSERVHQVRTPSVFPATRGNAGIISNSTTVRKFHRRRWHPNWESARITSRACSRRKPASPSPIISISIAWSVRPISSPIRRSLFLPLRDM